MSNPLGKTEQRRQLTAKKRQRGPTPAQQHMKAAGFKTDPVTLLEGLRLNKFKLDGLVADLHSVIYSDGIEEDEYGRHLFRPGLTDLRSLPAALLDVKEELPPPDLIPTTKIALDRFLRKLIICNGKDVILDELVAGWGDSDDPGKTFNRHIEDLWLLREDQAGLPLYDALVGGRFGSVIRYLRDNPKAANVATIRRLLVRQALIWCAHDVQMVVARLMKPISFGALGSGADGKQTPERELNHQRERYAALEDTLTAFFGAQDWRDPDLELVGPSSMSQLPKPMNAYIRRIDRSLRGKTRKPYVVPASLRTVTVMMRAIAAELRNPNETISAMAAAKTANQQPKTFSAKWFQVSSPVTAMAVSVRRLVQAESEVPAIIDNLIRNEPDSRPVALRGSLTGYDVFEQKRGQATRVDALMRFYRETLYDGNEDTRAALSPDWKPVREAKNFLEAVGARRFLDFRGTANDKRRALYLLDVIPEHRFGLG